VESFTGFIEGMVEANIGKAGRKYIPYVFSLFMFILFANILGLLPLGVVGLHPFTFTSHFTATGVLALMTISIVLVVGFWKHGLHFFSLFIPKDAPLALKIFIFPVELISFMVRPFSLGLRPFVAMFAGHILLEVFGNFVVQGLNAGGFGYVITVLCFLFLIFVSALELLVGAIQAYVFALLTALYIKDAVHLH